MKINQSPNRPLQVIILYCTVVIFLEILTRFRIANAQVKTLSRMMENYEGF